MKQIRNKNSKFYTFLDEIDKTLDLLAWPRVNPIFSEKPLVGLESEQIIIRYPETLEVIEHKRQTSSPSYHWVLIDNIALRFQSVAYWESKGMPSPLTIWHLQNAPIYVRVFYKTIRKFYKKSLVFLDDALPPFLQISIDPNFNLKKQRADILKDIANWVIRDGKTPKRALEKILKNERMSFKQSLDEILKLSKTTSNTALSYCLACGGPVEKGKMFCNAEQTGYKNKDNCRNKFRNWLRDRLHITDIKSQTKEREQYLKDLQELITMHPLGAFDIFRDRHPELYTKKYKERWLKRISSNKKS